MPRNHAVSATVALSDAGAALRNEELAKLFVQATPDEPWFRMEASSTEDHADVYILDAIGGWFGVDAGEFVRELMAIDKSKITLHLNSPGGAVFDGVMIYNALRTHKAEVTVQVEGIAASAASFIAQAGDQVIMQTGSMMMIHDASGIVMGNAQDMRDTADVLDKVSNNIASIYAHRAGEDTAFWRELMKEEVWYTAQEAVDAGLADSVDSKQAEDVSNKLLPVFAYQGRDQAPAPKQIRELVFNRLKENPVSGTAKTPTKVTPKNEGEGTEGKPAEEQKPAETESEKVGTEQPSEERPASAPSTGAQPENRVQGVSFIINGETVTDPAKIQAWITSQERAASEARVQNRKDFIKNLVNSNKLLASQVDDTENLVIGDGTDDNPGLTDKQYEKWCASWNAAPTISVLNKGVGDGNNSGSPQNDTQADLDDKLDVAREIVRNHKRTSMSQQAIENTDSWKLLKAHNALDTI